MNPADLIEWLRQHSSGAYRPSAEAADLIERLIKQNDALRSELQQEQHNYRELAAHHNKHCNCMEIY